MSSPDGTVPHLRLAAPAARATTTDAAGVPRAKSATGALA